MKKALYIILVICLISCLCACGGDDPTPENVNPKASVTEGYDQAQKPGSSWQSEKEEAPTATPTPTPSPTPEIPWDGSYMEKKDFLAYTALDLENIYSAIENQLDSTELEKVKAVFEEGTEAIHSSQTVQQAKDAYDKAYQSIMEAIPKADGIYSFGEEDSLGKAEILGILEKYAVSKGMTGITLYENGSYMMFNPRIELGTADYIPGYGFGILEEGRIDSDLEYESNSAWKRYYHTYISENSESVNVHKNQDETTAELYGFIGTSFYERFMNASKDGYEWMPVLAKEKPQPVNDEDGDGRCNVWRIEVKTGSDGLKYKTGSQRQERQKFDGREVELEDYEYAFKLLLTQSNGFASGKEMAYASSYKSIEGAKEYYEASAKGFDSKKWDKVGIKTYTEEGKSYFQITYTEEQDSFHAMYFISSKDYMPIPEDFIKLVTVKNYLEFSDDQSLSPVDNSLSLGAYYLRKYEPDQRIVFEKNEYYALADSKFQIPGIHVKIFSDSDNDLYAAVREFLAGHLDMCRVPSEYLKEYQGDSRLHQVSGNANFKLNINSLSDSEWERLFGENGIVKHSQSDEYWEVKPALQNGHFRRAMGYAIDRVTFALSSGSLATTDYLPSNFLISGENPILYVNTDAHKKVTDMLTAGTDGYGYSIELARDYFKMALTELESEGIYQPGTKEKPTEINLEIGWMQPSDEEEHHNVLKQQIEDIFNDTEVSGGVYKLNISFWSGEKWSDVYYYKMMNGQYDLGIGSVTGDYLDPIGLFGVMSQDAEISDGLTLNWGAATNDADDYPIVYRGVRWSFDALFEALDSCVYAENGCNKKPVQIEHKGLIRNEDGAYEGSFLIKNALPEAVSDEKLSFVTEKVICCNYDRFYYGDREYVEKELEFLVNDSGEDVDGIYEVHFTIPKEIADEYAFGEGASEKPGCCVGIDLYYSYKFNDVIKMPIYSVNDELLKVSNIG